MVIVCGTEIGLASGESLCHFDVEESISHAEALFHLCSLLDVLVLGWHNWAEQALHLLVALEGKIVDEKAFQIGLRGLYNEPVYAHEATRNRC